VFVHVRNLDEIISDIRDINDSGSLSKLTFGDRTPVTVEIGMTEADFSGAGIGAGGAIIIAAWLEHKVENTNVEGT
jgi:hypothetical protein